MGDHEAGGLVSSSSTASIVRDLHLNQSEVLQELSPIWLLPAKSLSSQKRTKTLCASPKEN
jgi:hypothetical protein